MANFDEIKQKTEETAEHIAAKSIELARSAAEKTKLVARISKLNADVISEKDALRRAYLDLGKLYYEKFKDEPDDVLADNCRRIASSLAVISQCRDEIDQCKAALKGDKAEESEECCESACPDPENAGETSEQTDEE